MSGRERGFTIIEVLIVVIVIAVLAAIALASVQDYTIRSKVSEAILAMSPCRTAVSEIYQGAGATAPGANNWGCEAGIRSKYVSKVETNDDGAVTVTITGVSGEVDGSVITLIPFNASGAVATVAADLGTAVRTWVCGGTGTTASARYLPNSCRGG